METDRLLPKNKDLCEKKIRNTGAPQKLHLFLLLSTIFSSYCNLTLIAQFFPGEASKKGVSKGVLGCIYSSYSLALFLSACLTGKIVAKFGARSTLLFGHFLSAVSVILFGTLGWIDDSSNFIFLAFLVRSFAGFGACLTESSVMVLLSMIYFGDGSFVGGVYTIPVKLGGSAGPTLGGLLFALGGFGLPFFTTGVVMILNVILISCLLPNRKYKYTLKKHGDASIKGLLKMPKILVCCVSGLLFSAVASMYTESIEDNLQRFNLGTVLEACFFLVPSTVSLLMTPFWIWSFKKYEYFWWLPFGWFCDAICFLFLGPSSFLFFIKDSLWLNLVALSLKGVFIQLVIMAAYRGVLQTTFENDFDCDESTQSQMSSVWIMFVSLGGFIGPVIGGQILENSNFRTLSSFAVVICLGMTLVTFIYYWKFNKKTK